MAATNEEPHAADRRQQLQDILRNHLPPCSHAFAYGSGVFKQPALYQPHEKGGTNGPMIDYILVVKDAVQWHQQNLQMNPSHYSFLKYFGARTIHQLAGSVGVGVYFNTLVPIGNQLIKYGVTEEAALMQDLTTWSHLYSAGRLHKPVLHLASLSPTQPLTQQLHSNLEAALATALLMSPQQPSLKDLFRRITGLSYAGDVRMGLAEDSKKVERIVAGSYEQFRELYLPRLQQDRFIQLGVQVLEEDRVQQPATPDSRTHLLSTLPTAVLAGISRVLKQPDSLGAQGGMLTQQQRLDVAHAAVQSGRHKQLLKTALRGIVGASSSRQAVLGLFSAGPIKSVIYLANKLKKAWR